jgi:general secretion pathway protein D
MSLACALASTSVLALNSAYAQETPPAQTETPPQAPVQGTLAMREVDIRAFIEDVSQATGRTFIIDPRVTGRVSVVANQALSERDLFDVFMSTLRVNGFAAVPTANGAYRIVPSAVGAREPATNVRGATTENTYVTQVFPLRFSDAESVAAAVRPMLSENGQVNPNRRGNSIVVVDYGSTIARLRDVIARLDRDSSNTRTIRLNSTSAAEMARVAESLGRTVGGGDERSVVQAVAVPSSNTLLLRGDAQTIAQIAPLIEELDAAADFQAAVQVIPLRYAVAEDLVPILQQLAASMTQAAGEAPAQGAEPAPAPGRRANIAAHKATNSLIVSADPETQESFAGVVRSLDVRREQVLVEAIIVEVSDEVAQELGLQFLAADPTGSNAVPFLSTSYANTSAPNLLALTGAVLTRNTRATDNKALEDLRRAAVSSLLGARGLLGAVGGQTDSGVIFGLILNALSEDRDSNVLSTPSVMTLDNETASILVGQQIPVTTGETLSDNFENQFRTVRREDVGVKLEVRPQISEGGAIRLQIKQEVSDIAGQIIQNSTDLITNRRQIETVVQVDAGQIVVLGGLIQENVQRTQSGIPGLRSIPLLGRAFRSEGSSRRRTNLMVFLRPTIVNTPDQARDVTARQLRSVQGQGGFDRRLEQRLQQQMQEAAPATPPAPLSLAPPPQPAPADEGQR